MKHYENDSHIRDILTTVVYFVSHVFVRVSPVVMAIHTRINTIQYNPLNTTHPQGLKEQT